MTLAAARRGPGPDRRRFLLGAGAAALALVPGRLRSSSPGPNILLITADDLGWRELGCYGNPHVRTPNLDRLAEAGVRFTNAFVTAPSCSASRASIITGQAPHSVHVLGLTHAHPRYQMSSDVPTLAGTLADAGCRTAIAGKWHVAAFKNTRPYGYQQRLSLLGVSDTAKARRYISARRDRPFYLEMNFIQPHRLADGRFRQDPDFPVGPAEIRVPDYWQVPNWPEVREDVAGYYSQTAAMDRLIGEVLDHLESEGLAERTLVVFVSDNGPPYPGCKTTCYDRGIGAPLILRWPGGLPGGRTADGLVSTVDLMPTCLESAGVPVPDTVQGKSLLPLARGETALVNDAVFAEVTYHVIYTPMRAIRTREWKYIENLSPDPTGLDQNKNFDWARRAAREPGQRCCVLRPPEELFYLTADPNEQTNLADDPAHAGIKSQLKQHLDQWRRDTRDPFPDLS